MKTASYVSHAAFALLLGVGLTAPIAAGSVAVTKPEEVGIATDRLRRIHETIQRHIDAKDIAGAVTLVARRGRIAHFEAHGFMDLSSKKPMTEDAIFRLASMSKPVTAVAILMLFEEGKLRLNDPVSRFIPEFKNPSRTLTSS
jgi:CubicO group peptidase (beta-lactamase class C family)